MSTIVVDYGVSNIASIGYALDRLGCSWKLARTAEDIGNASHVIIPGVGSFNDGMTNLHNSGLVPSLKKHAEHGRPLMGICLGMQLLADEGTEGGITPGLGFISGRIVPIMPSAGEKVPHMGWNNLKYKKEHPMFAGVNEGTDAYFVHGYHFECGKEQNITALVDFAGGIVAAVARDNIWGVQFHPEKSSKAGMTIIKNFLNA